MHTVRAILCLGLFGFLGYAVWTKQFVGGSSSKVQALNDVVATVTERYGTEVTSIFLFAAGIILAFLFLIHGEQDDRA